MCSATAARRKVSQTAALYSGSKLEPCGKMFLVEVSHEQGERQHGGQRMGAVISAV